MNHSTLIKCAIALLIAVYAALPASAAVDMKDFMDDMYLSTSTSPALVKTQARMGISGGSLHVRSPIRLLNVVSVAPPRVDIGGCGGISLFGGAFSMVTANEAKQLLRQIGGSAKAIAFSLALRMISETLFQNIKEKLDEMLGWTRKFKDTCEAARTVLEETGAKAWIEEESKQLGVFLGKFADGGRANQKESQDPGSTAAAAADQGKEDEITAYGNRIIKAINEKESTATEIGDLLGVSAQEGREIAMSLFGTQVYCVAPDGSVYDPEGEEDGDGDGGDQGEGPPPPDRNNDIYTFQPTLSIQDFHMSTVQMREPADPEIEGARGTLMATGITPVKLPVYQCNDEKCCDISPGEMEVYGFLDHVMESLDRLELAILGQDQDDLYLEENAQFVNAAKNVPVVTILTKYVHQPHTRSMMKAVMGELIARQFMTEFAEQMHRMSRRIYSGTDIPPHKGFEAAQQEVAEEVRRLRVGALDSLSIYNRLLATMKLIDEFNAWASPQPRMPGSE